MIGAVSAVACLFTLDQVIIALMSTRIMVQFIAQIAAVSLIRKQADAKRGFRMAFYPLPSLIALVGWVFILITSGFWYVLGGLGSLAVGICAYWIWTRWSLHGDPANGD